MKQVKVGHLKRQADRLMKMLAWGQVLDWMARWECFPGPNGVTEIADIPSLRRSRGTNYEEKVEAVSKSKR
jgi:hypothetical protein